MVKAMGDIFVLLSSGEKGGGYKADEEENLTDYCRDAEMIKTRCELL